MRPIIGVESADDQIRQQQLDKRMPRAAVRRAFDVIGAVATQVAPDAVGVDINVVVGAPGTAEGTIVADALATGRYVLAESQRVGLRSLDLNVHPYYPSQRSLARFPQHGRCAPETAARAMVALKGLSAEASNVTIRIFNGWQDEGHDQQQGRRRAELQQAMTAFAKFNRTQQIACLEPLLSSR